MKPSFIIYTQQLEKARKLSMEQRGLLLTAILDYHSGNGDVELDDPLVDMIFSLMRDSFVSNANKYNEKVNKCREAGLASAAARASKKKEETSAIQRPSTDVNVYDNDNYNDNVNENDNLDSFFESPKQETKSEIELIEEPTSVSDPIKEKKPRKYLTAEEQEFNEYLKQHFPRIAKMSKPLTLIQYKNLLDKYGQAILLDTMTDLENYAKINNYISASMTIDKWIKKDMEREMQNKSRYGNNRTSNSVNDPTDLIATLQQHHAEQKRGETFGTGNTMP